MNLGPPINSSASDQMAIFSPDGSVLYFNSARSDGYGEMDIWQVLILPVVDLNRDGKVDFKDFRKLAQCSILGTG